MVLEFNRALLLPLLGALVVWGLILWLFGWWAVLGLVLVSVVVIGVALRS